MAEAGAGTASPTTLTEIRSSARTRLSVALDILQRILGKHAAVHDGCSSLGKSVVGVPAFKTRGHAGGAQKGVEIGRLSQALGCRFSFGLVRANHGAKISPGGWDSSAAVRSK